LIILLVCTTIFCLKQKEKGRKVGRKEEENRQKERILKGEEDQSTLHTYTCI
jgi:hypothetical protein